MVTCTFDGTTVEGYQLQKFQPIGSSGTYHFEMTLVCRAANLNNYNTLAGKFGRVGTKTLYNGKTKVQTKGGTSGSLVFNGTTYTNCYISDLSAAEVSKTNLGMYEYTISFVKNAAA